MRFKLSIWLVVLAALLSSASNAQAEPNKKYKLAEEGTPMSRALQDEWEQATPDANDSTKKVSRGKKFKQPRIKKACNPNKPGCAPEDIPCEDCGEIRDSENNLVARKQRGQLEVEYEFATEQDVVKLRIQVPAEAPEPNQDEAGLVDSETSVSYTRFGPPVTASADSDCVDVVTGAKVSNSDCFNSNGMINKNLVNLENAEIRSCLHKDPVDNSIEEIIYEPISLPGTNPEEIEGSAIDTEGRGQDLSRDGVCFDAMGTFKETSLVPMVAEDELYGEALCEYLAEENGFNPNHVDYVTEADAAYCDFTRAFMVKANKKDEKNSKDPRYLINDNGDLINPEDLPKDDNGKAKGKHKNAKRYGGYPRTAKVREEVTLKCRGNRKLVDELCWDIDSAAESSLLYRSTTATADAFAGGSDYPNRSETNGMLMGFTWAPPVEEWGYSIYEEECVLGVCVELLEARIGYKFDVAAGLRFPIDVTMENLPPERNVPDSVIAESEVTIKTSVEPADWTVGDYKKYCDPAKYREGESASYDPLPYDCEDRFAFPEYFDNMINDLKKEVGFPGVKNPNDVDGSEAVARADVFIGGKLEVLGIELLGLYLGADVDIMTACTAQKMRDIYKCSNENDGKPCAANLDVAFDVEDLIEIFEGEGSIKSLGLICGSFATPFGGEDIIGVGGITIPADCNDAKNIPFTKRNGKPAKKLCSKLELDKKGAKLGIDLTLGLGLTGKEITAEAGVANGTDGCNKQGVSVEGAAGQFSCAPQRETLTWKPGDLDKNFVITADNFNAHRDIGRVVLSDFSLVMGPVITLSASLNFGGVLDLIPNIGLDLYSFNFPGEIPISQHDDEVTIGENFFVRNYALEVDGSPIQTCSPDTEYCTTIVQDQENTMEIKPGETGNYELKVKNLGSVEGGFDNFRVALSNRPDQSAVPSYTFLVNQNTDFDCVDESTPEGSYVPHYRGNPYNDTLDDCYDESGKVLSSRRELINEDGGDPDGTPFEQLDKDNDGLVDEDPEDVWQLVLNAGRIDNVTPGQLSTTSGTVAITPFKHFRTRPGIYPVQILADSVEAKSNQLAAIDPAGFERINAEDVVFIKAEVFRDPQVLAQPKTESEKPGVRKSYSIRVTNGSNDKDEIQIDTDLLDFNKTACTLTTLGKENEGCPYRAANTAILPIWTNGQLPTPTSFLAPGAFIPNEFTVDVPSDWAGMEDTNYQVMFTVTSLGDENNPQASSNVIIEQTVVATMESMTRYIGLELAELIAVLDQANAKALKTAGLKPISVNAVQRANDRALASILSGNLGGAARSHAANIRIMGGFTRALAGSGKSLPPELFDDLNARAVAIITDMTKAESSQIPSN